MIQTINSSDFVQAFRAYGRQDQFSRQGLEMLFDHIEEIDPNFELDVIGLCCDYAESDPLTIAQDYNIDLIPDEIDIEDSDAVRELVLDYLNENSCVVGVTDTGSIVYATSF